MSFRRRVYLRLVLTFAAAVALTGLALNLAVNAQEIGAGQPLFVMTDKEVFAVYPFEDRHIALDIPGRPWNMVLSPDGATLLLDSQPDAASPALDYYAVDVETLDIRQLPLRDAGAQVNGMPVWRWDSAALLYTEFDENRVARVVEYALANGERTVRADDLQRENNLSTSGVPLTIYWSPEAFALLHYDDDHKAYLLRYDSSGTALTPVMLFDPLNPDNPDSLYFDNFIQIAGEDGSLLAVRRPGIKQWDVIDVVSGEITRLDEGTQIVKAPVRQDNPRFVMTIDEAVLFPPIHNLAALIDGQRGLFLPEPQSVLTISPDGEAFAVTDADGFAVSDGSARITVNLPPNDSTLAWRVAWAPLEGRIERVASSPEASLDMPLYFIDTLDCLNRWTLSGGITDEQCPNEHGGTRHFGISPDASKLLWITHALLADPPYELNWSFIDTQSFSRIAGRSTGEQDDAPLWRWDSGATAEIAFHDAAATMPMLLEYDITTGDLTIVLDHLPVAGDSETYSAPQPLWWTEETIGMRYHSAASGETTLMVYLPNGDPMLQMLISTSNAPDSRVTHIVPLAGEGETVAALYYPDQNTWKLLSPQTAELTPLPDGFTVAEAPATNAAEAHYCRTIYDDREPQQVIVCATGETVLDEPAARVEISPDGNTYAYATPDGIMVGGMDMPETVIYANERQNPMNDRWFMAWSGMVGRVVPGGTGSAGSTPETPVSLEGALYQTVTIDGSTELQVTVDWGSADNNYRRVDRLYLLDTAAQSLTKLLETDSMILEGPVALTPDRQTVLFSAYSDETGAAIWRMDVPQAGAPASDPVMLANGLMFWADAGNFALPTFVEVTDETFTISTFGLDWSGKEPRELGEIITYSLDGDLLHSEPKLTPTDN